MLLSMKNREDSSDRNDGSDDVHAVPPGLVGVSPDKTTKKFRARLYYGGNKEVFVGTYELASDAALARDRALRLVKGSNEGANFQSERDHLNARADEMRRTGLGKSFQSIQEFMSSNVDAAVAKALTSADKEDGEEVER